MVCEKEAMTKLPMQCVHWTGQETRRVDARGKEPAKPYGCGLIIIKECLKLGECALGSVRGYQTCGGLCPHWESKSE